MFIYRFPMKTPILCSMLFCSFSSFTWGITTRLSVNAQGIEGNSNSFLLSSAALSAEGRYVIFSSEASNLVPEDKNDTFDLFIYDIWLKQMMRVSIDTQGQEDSLASQTPVLSANGRYVAFSSFANHLVPKDNNQASDIFIYDVQTRQMTRITPPSGQESNGDSFHPTLSADGNIVVFDSQANNWLDQDENSSSDIFIYDRATNEIQRISSPGNVSHPHLSAYGRYVAFEVHETFSQIFIYDLQTQQTRLLTSGANGNSFAPFISAEGQYVTFVSEATNLVPNHDVSVSDIFIQNLQTNHIVGLHVDDQASFPALSKEGQSLVFSSYATHLVSEDSNGTADIFRYERDTQQIERINVNDQNQEGNFGPFLTPVAISMSGCTIAFDSSATNLVSHDTNNSFDVFVRQMVTQSPKFDFATMFLDLPTIQITGGEVYRAQLQFMPSNMSTFILNDAKPISSPNKSCAYFSPESGLLYLPLVEVYSSGQKLLYEVVMRIIAYADPLQFEIVQATPYSQSGL